MATSLGICIGTSAAHVWSLGDANPGPPQPLVAIERRPDEDAADVVPRLLEMANTHLSDVATTAAVTIPGRCGQSHRIAVLTAMLQAGIPGVQLITTTIATGVSWWIEQGQGLDEVDLATIEWSEGTAVCTHLTVGDGVIEEVTGQTYTGIDTPEAAARVLSSLGEGRLVDRVLVLGESPAHSTLAADLPALLGRRVDLVSGGEMASGAARCAAQTSGADSPLLFLPVVRRSLGLETKGGVFTPLIPRNVTYPTKRSEIFTTADDNQPSILIQLFEGENEATARNTHIGAYELSPIPPAPRGIPKIEVTFDVTPNGIVSVSARDLTAGQRLPVNAVGEGFFNEPEVNRLIASARQNVNDRTKQFGSSAGTQGRDSMLSVGVDRPSMQPSREQPAPIGPDPQSVPRPRPDLELPTESNS